MPIYEYKCKSCDNEFDESHKIDDRLIPTETPCNKCGGEIYISLGTPGFVDPMRITTRGVKKVPGVFKDRLKEIAKTHPGHKINIP